MKVTKKTNINKLIEKYPKAARIMFKHGLHCVGCYVAAFETIEQGARAHGMDKKTVGKMLRELNRTVK
ncbi:MAG: DUF1858 domain-containing protein [Nanoarchaeota archaeon]